jgi:hypothetical protein
MVGPAAIPFNYDAIVDNGRLRKSVSVLTSGRQFQTTRQLDNQARQLLNKVVRGETGGCGAAFHCKRWKYLTGQEWSYTDTNQELLQGKEVP